MNTFKHESVFYLWLWLKWSVGGRLYFSGFVTGFNVVRCTRLSGWERSDHLHDKQGKSTASFIHLLSHLIRLFFEWIELSHYIDIFGDGGFTKRSFAFLWVTLCLLSTKFPDKLNSLSTLLRFSEKHCLHSQNFCVPPKKCVHSQNIWAPLTNFAFSKKIAFPWTTFQKFCISKKLHLLTKPDKHCIVLQNFCIPPTNFAFSH